MEQQIIATVGLFISLCITPVVVINALRDAHIEWVQFAIMSLGLTALISATWIF